MRRSFLAGVVLTLSSFALFAQQKELPPLERIIARPQSVSAKPSPCSGVVPHAVWLLGGKAHVLTGAERLPGLCDDGAAAASGEIIDLYGMTVAAALDKLVEIDPRYRWAERNGVIVLRPVAAWSDPQNPLNRVIEGDGEQVRRKFSIDVPSGPAVNALDEIVRAHRALSWLVQYHGATPNVDAMEIHLYTFENAGTMTQRHPR